jgi:hypothetical protein
MGYCFPIIPEKSGKALAKEGFPCYNKFVCVQKF